jgi:hypothetical protein
VLLAAAPAVMLGQGGFAGIFQKAPPEIERALRERVDLFLQAHLTQDWGKALQAVHPESVNAFIGADKMKFRAYKIVAITWEENYTSAKVVIDYDTEFFFPGFGKRDVHVPLTSQWKLKDNQWYWYAVPFNPERGKTTPFGAMFRESGEKGVPGEAPDISKMIASGPSLAELRSRVTIDKPEVLLQSHVPSEGTIKVSSKFDGPVHLKVEVDDLPCLTWSIDKTVLEPGETATVRFACKPETPVKKPDGRATITVEEIAKVMPVQITFAYPPSTP